MRGLETRQDLLDQLRRQDGLVQPACHLGRNVISHVWHLCPAGSTQHSAALLLCQSEQPLQTSPVLMIPQLG